MAKQRVPRTRGGGRYTEAEFRAKIRSALRQISVRWPPRSDCIKAASRPATNADRQRLGNNRIRSVTQCAVCQGWFAKADIEVDHIHGNHPLLDIEQDLGKYTLTLLCEVDDLRCVCKTCHAEHTEAQRASRKRK